MATDDLETWLGKRVFYELMQAYRMAPVGNQAAVVAAFEAVKARILRVHKAELDAVHALRAADLASYDKGMAVMAGSWRPCCGVCRSEKISAVEGYRCADCKADWDGSELTEREAQATPRPAWLPKPYPGPGSAGG